MQTHLRFLQMEMSSKFRLCFEIIVLPAFLILQCTAVAIRDPRRSSARVDKIVNATNYFAIRQYKLFPGAENSVFSPARRFAELATAYYGSRGQTAEELKTGMGLTQAGLTDFDEAHQAYKELMEKVSDPSTAFKMFHKLIIYQDFPILESYQNGLRQYYQCQIENIYTEPELLASINDWVKEKTGGRVEKEIDDPEDLESIGEVWFYLNAIYYDDTWEYKFPEENTRLSAFYNRGESLTQVPTMSLYGATVKYTNSEELESKIAELPYAGRNTSMIFILPHQMQGLQSVEDKLTPESLQNAINSLRIQRGVHIKIPKFSVEKTHEDMEPYDFSLGIKKLHIPFQADVSGISPVVSYLGGGSHRERITVKEDGKHDYVFMQYGNAISDAGLTFVADHPFLFLITERATGLILFMGRVYEL